MASQRDQKNVHFTPDSVREKPVTKSVNLRLSHVRNAAILFTYFDLRENRKLTNFVTSRRAGRERAIPCFQRVTNLIRRK